MKYVIIETAGTLKPIVFDHLLKHSMFRNHKVVSAGFINIWADEEEIQVGTWGKSISLDIASKPGDAGIIKRTLTRDY